MARAPRKPPVNDITEDDIKPVGFADIGDGPEPYRADRDDVQTGDIAPEGDVAEDEAPARREPDADDKEQLRAELAAVKAQMAADRAERAAERAALQNDTAQIRETQERQALAEFNRGMVNAEEGLKAASHRYREALQSGDPELIEAAENARYDARRHLERYQEVSERVRAGAGGGPSGASAGAPGADRSPSARPSGAPPPRQHLDDFKARTPWYDTDDRKPLDQLDADSRRVREINQELLAETGIKALSPEHIRALERELKRALPHRYGGRRETPPQRVAGTGRGGVPAGGGREARIPAETIEAMKRVGLKTDPKSLEEFKARHGHRWKDFH